MSVRPLSDTMQVRVLSTVLLLLDVTGSIGGPEPSCLGPNPGGAAGSLVVGDSVLRDIGTSTNAHVAQW